MTRPIFVTPQTDDGIVETVQRSDSGCCEVEIRFRLTPRFRASIDGRESEVTFASRSRLARLGIDVTPTGPLETNGDSGLLRARLEAAIPSYGVAEHLPHVVVPGLEIGRLVFCPSERRLDSGAILEAIGAGDGFTLLVVEGGTTPPAGPAFDSTIYWRKLSDGRNGVWRMNGTSLEFIQSLPTVAASSGWQFVGSGRFDHAPGDGDHTAEATCAPWGHAVSQTR